MRKKGFFIYPFFNMFLIDFGFHTFTTLFHFDIDDIEIMTTCSFHAIILPHLWNLSKNWYGILFTLLLITIHNMYFIWKTVVSYFLEYLSKKLIFSNFSFNVSRNFPIRSKSFSSSEMSFANDSLTMEWKVSCFELVRYVVL